MAGWRRCPTPLSIPELCRGNSGTIHPRAGNVTPHGRRGDNKLATDIPSDVSRTSRPVDRKDAMCRLGLHVHPCRKVEGLVLRKRGGSSSLPGRIEEPCKPGPFAALERSLGSARQPSYEHRGCSHACGGNELTTFACLGDRRLPARSSAPCPHRLIDKLGRSRAGPARGARPGRRLSARGRAHGDRCRVEPQIEHNKRGLADLDRPQRLPRPGGTHHAEAVGSEVVEQKGTREVVVLHHQDQALLLHITTSIAGENLAPAAAAMSFLILGRPGGHGPQEPMDTTAALQDAGAPRNAITSRHTLASRPGRERTRGRTGLPEVNGWRQSRSSASLAGTEPGARLIRALAGLWSALRQRVGPARLRTRPTDRLSD